MDVQQGGADADPGPGQTDPGEGGGRRLGLIVGLALALLVALVAVVVLLSRDAADDATASNTPTVTATVTAAPTATPTPTGTPTPTTSPAPGDVPDLRADSLGALELRMSKQEALDTGLVTEATTALGVELIADADTLPGVFVCWDPDTERLTSFLVKDGSPITTPDGIGVGSTVDDLRAAYGVLLQEREADGEAFYAVPVDDVGYAFFPTARELVLLAGTDEVVASVTPGTEPC